MITKSILIVGAGRSSTSLIQYLLKQAAINSWHVIVGDFNEVEERPAPTIRIDLVIIIIHH